MLLVEDEPMVRKLTARILRELGYAMLEAANGVEALAVRPKFAGEDIHLLLTEVVMPEMGGRKLAERFATTLPRAKLIYISGYTENAFLKQGPLEPDHPFTGYQRLRYLAPTIES